MSAPARRYISGVSAEHAMATALTRKEFAPNFRMYMSLAKNDTMPAVKGP